MSARAEQVGDRHGKRNPDGVLEAGADFDELTARFTAWADRREDVRGMAVFGSRAVTGRVERRLDQLAE